MSNFPATKVILVVDDECLIRAFVSNVLEDEGYEVVEAADADTALVLLLARPDVLVLITDVDMPSGSMNGYELAFTVNERSPDISIIVISGRSWPGLTDMPAGAVFLSKPVSPTNLAAQVKLALGQAEVKRGVISM